MDIGAVKAITFTDFSAPAKDPPWGAEDLSKLRLLMDQGLSDSQMAKALGTTINDVRQKVASLSSSTSDTANNGSSSGAQTPNPLIGSNLNIRV